MKLSNLFRRTGTLALAGLIAAGGLWASLRADAVDIEESTAGFSNPAITRSYINNWVEGIPEVNSENFNKKFPVLMTWDDKYYMRVTSSFAQQMENHVGDTIVGEDMMNGWSNNDDDSGYVNGDFDADGQYPHGSFRQNMGYPGYLLSELEMIDFTTLNRKGSFLTIGSPEGLPNLIPISGRYSAVGIHTGSKSMTANPVYLLEADISDDDYHFHDASWVDLMADDGGLRRGENYIIGLRRNKLTHWTTEESFLGIPYTEHNLACGWYWSLYGLNETTYNNLKNNRAWTRSYSSTATWKNLVNRNMSDKWWRVDWGWYVVTAEQNNKKYACFWTPGTHINGQPYETCDEMDDYAETVKLISLDAKIGLAHYGGNFESRGNWNGDDVEAAFKASKKLSDFQYAFRCFYAQPYPMNFAQTSFTVEKGQVYNLDGPMVIGQNCKITVKDGGTLTVSGWVMNNGQIYVEKGGTLYVQDNACMNRYNDGGFTGGSVYVEGGLVLVGKNAKLIGGGWDGLQFYSGSHAVNYGCIASENVWVVDNYTIENRGSGFVLFGSGNGVMYSGSLTYETELSGQTFAERGTLDPYGTVSIPPNGVYKGNN